MLVYQRVSCSHELYDTWIFKQSPSRFWLFLVVEEFRVQDFASSSRTHILPHHEPQLITKAVEIGIHHHSMHPHGIEATSLVAMAAIWQP